VKQLLFVLVLMGCAGEATGDEVSVSDLLPPPGRYQLTAPLIECGLAECPRGCPAVSMSTVDVGADATAIVDACPRGWSCAHGIGLPLELTYSPTLPKSGGVVCSYDVGAGTFGPWLQPQAGEL
jgi:hypothetical protein